MKIAHTLARGVEFRYDGNPELGTSIEFGDGYTCNMTVEEYSALRNAFPQGSIVRVGASRTNPPEASLGAWLKANIHEQRSIASYVAAILVDAQWAYQIDTKTICFNYAR